MSDRDAFRANSLAWTDRISRTEFERRLATSTQRRVPVDERAEFRERRMHGLAARHEKRLEAATYTAAEVKVLTETVRQVAYALGRKDAGEEIAQALEEYLPYYSEEFFPADGTSVDCIAAKAMRHAYPNAAGIALDIASQPSGASSEPLSGSGVGTGDTEGSEAPEHPGIHPLESTCNDACWNKRDHP